MRNSIELINKTYIECMEKLIAFSKEKTELEYKELTLPIIKKAKLKVDPYLNVNGGLNHKQQRMFGVETV